MTYDKLIESLCKDCEEKIRLIREETDSEIEKLRTEAVDKIKCMTEECKRAQSLSIKERTDAIISDAEKTANAIMVASENSLSERLYSMAMNCLSFLRNEEYNIIFKKLIDELPKLQWQQIEVNPKDVEIVKRYFPEANVNASSAITGGIDVRADNGRVRIINTLEKRLERGWADILPEMLKDVYKLIKIGCYEAATDYKGK